MCYVSLSESGLVAGWIFYVVKYAKTYKVLKQKYISKEFLIVYSSALNLKYKHLTRCNISIKLIKL